jgi:hypothetical protein
MNQLTRKQQDVWLKRTHEVLHSISSERVRKLDKWGTQAHNSEIWLAIIGKEFGELSQAVLESKFNHHLSPADAKSRMIHEARKVAASAAALVQYLAHGEA